jgi:threonine aldolase
VAKIGKTLSEDNGRDRTDADVDADPDSLRETCSRFLLWHGQRTAEQFLSEISSDTVIDTYGNGGVVQELEAEVAAVLGKPAAVFVPSGTMAQQATLRVHADRRGRRVVVFHPACHLDRNEDGAYQRLHGLIGRPTGDPNRLLMLEDLKEVAEPPAALVLELPQRDLGGELPTWDDLLAQVAWARDRGAAVHMDGARLWECTPAFARSPAEIAEPFDTVYVSLYKGLGGLSGCCVAGPEDVVAEVREWRTRHGGTLFMLWPYAASDLSALRTRLPRMPAYRRHALSIADALRDLPGVEVVPDPPHTTMMHLVLSTTAERFRSASLAIAAGEGIWTWARSWATEVPSLQRVELTVGDATLGFTPAEVRGLVERLLTHVDPTS